eukprot:Unigene4052_Nuclearia_a/m.12308 Unigene4052_Nuclearia_a/g.12308  ORF Unigene4052_Nuclearia_a/g.12308 Unigene4052_Nuclearia_a/m.12308 type:complete len:355 (+) Unigene4052_Nuclearia_a:4157-5221(+)
MPRLGVGVGLAPGQLVAHVVGRLVVVLLHDEVVARRQVLEPVQALPRADAAAAGVVADDLDLPQRVGRRRLRFGCAPCLAQEDLHLTLEEVAREELLLVGVVQANHVAALDDLVALMVKLEEQVDAPRRGRRGRVDLVEVHVLAVAARVVVVERDRARVQRQVDDRRDQLNLVADHDLIARVLVLERGHDEEPRTVVADLVQRDAHRVLLDVAGHAALRAHKLVAFLVQDLDHLAVEHDRAKQAPVLALVELALEVGRVLQPLHLDDLLHVHARVVRHAAGRAPLVLRVVAVVRVQLEQAVAELDRDRLGVARALGQDDAVVDEAQRAQEARAAAALVALGEERDDVAEAQRPQ